MESFEQTFANTGLTTVIMQERTQTISDFAFTNCKKLQNVTLPKSLVNIGANAFLGCSELKQIHLPQNVQTIINNYL